MKSLNDAIRANRFDVFRHTLHSIALASAAASGLGLVSGCDDPIGSTWVATCGENHWYMTDLTGLRLPDGADALAVAFGSTTPVYTAGDFCEAGVACLLSGPIEPEPTVTVFVRRAGVVERSSVDEVIGRRVDTPQEAALRVLQAEGERLHCTDTSLTTFGPGPLTGRVVATSGGFDVVLPSIECSSLGSPGEVVEITYHVTASGDVGRGERDVVEENLSCPIAGRLTAGIAAPCRPEFGAELGRYFAQAAGSEAAAVDAFERMAEELNALGAPAELVQWARASADDERRHTRTMGVLAEHFAVTWEPHAPRRFALRGLFDVALENAVEGCVRETYGAVVAHHQAEHAQDQMVRAALVQVAEDETRHAALSWAVAEWALPQLSETQRSEIRTAQRGAMDALNRSVRVSEADVLLKDAGLPSPRVALAMLQALEKQVWA